MTRVSTALLALCLTPYWCFTALADPTLQETEKYLDDKLKTPRVEDLALQGLEIKGSILTHFYRTYTDDAFQPSFTDWAISIDLRRVHDFDVSTRNSFINDKSYSVRLTCDSSDNLCAARKSCFEGKKDACTDWQKISEFDPFGLQLHFNDTDIQRIRAAIVHLKSFFPFEKKQELFDKR